MFVDSEVLTGLSGMAVYKNTIQNWDPPNDKIPITNSDHDRILTTFAMPFVPKASR